MYYSLILLSVLLFSSGFALNDTFRKERGDGLAATLEYSLISSVAALIVLFIINGFQTELTAFTLIMAALTAINGFLFSLCTLKALKTINLSVYSVFSMLGGMLLPFLQGILFFSEKFTLAKSVCLVAITVALMFTLKKGSGKKGLIYYIGIFVLNGMSGVLSKIYTSAPYEKASPEGYTIWMMICILVISAVGLLFYRQKGKKFSPRALFSGATAGVINRIANLWLVIALMHVDASVQYPMVTGGTMIASTLFCFFGKNKPKKNELIAVGLAFLGMLALFIFPQ